MTTTFHKNFCLFEVDPETLEVTADPVSALYIRSEVPGLLILRNIYFTYNPPGLIDLKILFDAAV